MSDVALFDLDVIEDTWAPVWEKSIEDFGWHWGEKLPLHADGTPISKAEWSQYLASGRCRDCGVTCPLDMGGGDAGRGFRICKGCALLDGARIVEHDAHRCEPRPDYSMPWTIAADCSDCGWTVWTERFADAQGMLREPTPAEVIDAEIVAHHAARWASRWGKTHPLEEHENVVRARAERRARYLAAVAQ